VATLCAANGLPFLFCVIGNWRTPWIKTHPTNLPCNFSRAARAASFSSKAAAASIMSLGRAGVRQAAWAAGSDAPEKKEVKVGFIPLTDCASVVMASVLKFDEKYGIKIIPTKESSWAGVRDKTGERRTRCRTRTLRIDLRRASGQRRSAQGHGDADEF
jgi:hypothetical protein